MRKKNADRKVFIKKGLTLIELMATILVIAVLALSLAASYYHANLNIRTAHVNCNVRHTGLMLLESWRGVNGDETYNPVALFGSDIAIVAGGGPIVPAGFASLGEYEIQLQDIDATCFATLSWKDIDSELRALNVAIDWHRQGNYDSDSDYARSMSLTTFVLR